MKLGDAKPQTRGENARLETLVDQCKLGGKWLQVRILPDEILSMRQHWINIIASKTKREVRIPKMCLAHDPITEELDGECPYCDVNEGAVSYLANVIVRQFQDDAPAKLRMTKAERESGFKDMNSESWTPIRVLRLTAGLMRKVQELKALNKVKGPKGLKTFDVNHEKFGVDLNIKYDENAKGPEKYQVNMAERTPITAEELEYLKYELTPELIKELGVETVAEAKRELGRMQIVGAEEFDNDDDDDDDVLGKKKSKSSKSKKFDDDDDSDDDSDDDDDDDTPTKRGAKKPSTKKPAQRSKRPSDDDDLDDDDDDDDDLDDEDDDDTPQKRGTKKPAAKPSRGKKPVDDDDDDDDDEGDDEDEDDDDFDDEDDDEPAPKRGAKKPASKKPAAKPTRGKKPVDDDDDDDLDDDDEDEPAPKRGVKKPAAKKPAAKPSRGKKPVDDDEVDDDDDDDIPF